MVKISAPHKNSNLKQRKGKRQKRKEETETKYI